MHKSLFVVALALLPGVVPSFAVAKDAPATVAQAATEQDRANIKLMKDFYAAWKGADHGSEYLSANASVRLEADKPPLIGKKAYVDRWAALEPGQTVTPKVVGFYARNPAVVTLRLDTLKTPGKPDQIFDEVGIAVPLRAPAVQS